MSDQNENPSAAPAPEAAGTQQTAPTTPSSNATTPASSVTGIPTRRLKAPTNFGGSSSSVSKIGRPCSHATPKAGPPPRGTYKL